MSDVLPPQVGAVLSADIAVPEHQREVRFYSQVLSTGTNPLWREDLMNNQGTPIIGLGAQSAEYANLPLQWMPHIQVSDVQASSMRAVELGGSVLMQSGAQWAVLSDPGGAAFGIVPVTAAEKSVTKPSNAVANVGRIAWLDLTVPNGIATREFYREVIGWSVEDVPMSDQSERYSDFNMLGADGKPMAGICHARGANLGLPPVWMIYLPVGDLGESLRRVEREGGKVIRSKKDSAGRLVYAAIQDPVGACLALAPGKAS